MRRFTRFATTGLLLLCLVISLLSFPVEVQALSYSTSSNSGTRDQVCTSLDGTSAGSYYTGSYTYATLSGQSQSALLQSLRKLMTDTHSRSTSYGNCKDYADQTDCQNGDGTIVTLYTSYVTSHSEYNSGNGWNREHVWPKSLGGFETSGPGADLHHIRPTENRTNSDRGNLKYGNVSGGSASKGNLSGEVGGHKGGGYYEPLDNVKGDVARICLYVYVRYGGSWNKCSSITNVFQSVDVLLEWMAIDPVDTWEMGRNEVVAAIQGNRNVFIDYPELAWTLFGRQAPKNMSTPSGNAASGNVGNGGNSGNSGTTKPAACTHATTELRNVKDANCKEGGYTGDTYCTKCNKKLSDGKPTDITGHTETLVGQKDATCAEAGYTGDTICSVCNETLATGQEIPKSHSHTFGKWETTKQPTDTEAGEKARTCEVCGFQHKESIPSLHIGTPQPAQPTVSIWIWVGIGAAGCAMVIAVTVILLKRKKNAHKA